MDKHTPGPWRAYRTRRVPWWKVVVVADGGRELADVEPGEATVYNNPSDPAQVAADARLIAAAPAMLEALRKLAGDVAPLVGRGLSPESLQRALDAIRLATEEE